MEQPKLQKKKDEQWKFLDGIFLDRFSLLCVLSEFKHTLKYIVSTTNKPDKQISTHKFITHPFLRMQL